MGKGINTTCDEGQTPIVTGFPDPAYAISAGSQGKGGVFGSGRDSQDTFAVTCFHPTQDPISSEDGLTHALGTGSSGGCATAAVAFSHSAAGNSYAVAHGLTRALTSCKTLAVAFTAKDSGGDAVEGIAPTMRAMSHSASHANGGGQLAVAFTKSKRAQSVTDDETWVPGEVSPTMSCFDQGDTRATTVVAQAFTYSGYSNEPAWMTGDRTDCLPASGHSDGSHQGVGVVLPIAIRTAQTSANGHGVAENVAHTLDRAQGQGAITPVPMVNMQGSKGNAVAQADGPSYSLNSMHGHDVHAIAAQMAVRRLTPRECERLQGFPDDYTLVTYRGKPAADGPRYRALGNSMAVPVMRWIGQRIAKVDRL
jgi:DNA (cytosine-5)-methyltransferase 1